MPEMTTPEEFRSVITSALKKNDRWVLVAGCPHGFHIVQSLEKAILSRNALFAFLEWNDPLRTIQEVKRVAEKIHHGVCAMHILPTANRGEVLVAVIDKDLVSREALEGCVRQIPGMHDFETSDWKAVVFSAVDDVKVQERCGAFIDGLFDGAVYEQTPPNAN